MKKLKTYKQLFEKNTHRIDNDSFVNLFKKESDYNIDNSLIQILLDSGNNINVKRSSDGWTPLYQATAKKLTETVKFLLENGADPNIQADDGSYPLKMCTSYYFMLSDERWLNLIKLLTKYGANWNLLDEDGYCAFDEYERGVSFEISKEKQKLIELFPKEYKEYLLHKDLEKFNI